MIQLPKCVRDRSDCTALHQIRADEGKSFMCCGLNDGSNRQVDGDVFRLCVRGTSDDIDRMEDCDRHDLLDEALVILSSLSVAENLIKQADAEGGSR